MIKIVYLFFFVEVYQFEGRKLSDGLILVLENDLNRAKI